ncbi:MAG: hypothetical protein WCH44_05205, partial [Betaproteobacteria bacterium]
MNTSSLSDFARGPRWSQTGTDARRSAQAMVGPLSSAAFECTPVAPTPKVRQAARLFSIVLMTLCGAAQAQLSAPIPAGKAAAQPALPASIDLPGGSGPGVHSPNSPFAPL